MNYLRYEYLLIVFSLVFSGCSLIAMTEDEYDLYYHAGQVVSILDEHYKDFINLKKEYDSNSNFNVVEAIEVVKGIGEKNISEDIFLCLSSRYPLTIFCGKEGNNSSIISSLEELYNQLKDNRLLSNFSYSIDKKILLYRDSIEVACRFIKNSTAYKEEAHLMQQMFNYKNKEKKGYALSSKAKKNYKKLLLHTNICI
jgi:hypothetical protein